MKKALSLALVTLIVFSMLSILQINPVMAATDEYFIYSWFDPPGIGDVVGVGGYVEYYGVPEWGDEIQYVYFLSGTTGYKVKVTVTDGDGDGKVEPRQHPNHYLSEFQGPIEPRNFEIVSSANLAGYTSGSGEHTEEFYVDSGGVYLGAYSNGIHEWDHDWNFLGKIANRPPTRTESMAYNPAENVWYAGGRTRTIYQLSDTDSDGSFLDESWTAIFTYPSYGGSHHDGMEYVGGYLWISDMTSDVIGKWEYDTATSAWKELKRFTYTETADVEGMGFGPNDHFWCGSGWGSGSYIYELGNEITKGYPLADAGDDVDAHPPTIPVEFDASGSHHTDPAKEIVLYEWDFESDGTWDYSGTDLAVEHTYPAYYNPDGSIDWSATAKDYTATLRVTDNSDPALQDTDTCIVHITGPPWKPVADPNGPYVGSAGSPVQLDGSQSYDPESMMFPSDHPWYETIATYEWDLDNDGEFDDATGANPTHTWSSEGLYIIRLKVTDSQPSGPGGVFGPLDMDTKYTTVDISEMVVRVTVTIVEVRAIDTMDPFGGAADFYAKCSIDGNSLPDETVYRGNDDDVYPEWTFSLVVPKNLVPIHIEIWDDDLIFDDHVDIDEDADDRDLDLFFNVATQGISGDATYGYSNGGGDSNRAEIWFNIGLDGGDKDGDGLFDIWETVGIHMDGDDTVDLDLPALGASPDHKDKFLEIDWMRTPTHTHEPLPGVTQAIVNAFANAPVSNPDGTNGILLHIDVDNNPIGGPLGSHQDIITFSAAGQIGGSDFDRIKSNNFDPDRRFVYHYCLFAHNIPQSPRGGWYSGIAELPGNDFVVSLGAGAGGVGTTQQQMGTLMHEFGHNLYLTHGGSWEQRFVNYKPNYISVMNYFFQMSGILPAGRIDYSRNALPDLDENSLNENLGIQDGTDQTLYVPPGRTPNNPSAPQPGTGPIDWNDDGLIQGNVVADINGDNSRTILTGHDDWANLRMNSRGTTDFEDGVHLSAEDLDCPDSLTVITPQVVDKYAEGPAAVPLRTKESWNFTILVTNIYDYEIYNLTVKDHFGANLDVAFLSSTKGTYTQYTNKPGRQQRFTWTIESLAPFETVTLKLEVSTGLNPAKKQQFTSAGLKILNSGATVKWVNASGRQGSAESGQISIWAGVSVSDTAGAIAGYVTSVGEPLRGYVIELRDSTGTLVATTTTDKNGFYGFSSLAPTDYTVICLTQSYTATVKAEQVKRIDFEFD